MTETKHYCDRCSALIERRTLIRIEAGPLRAHHEAIDLCGDCSSDFLAFLDERPAEVEAVAVGAN